MTTRQKILKLIQPALAGISRLSGKNADVLHNSDNKEPAVPFYSLKFNTADGKEVSFEQYRGKKVVLVNVASFCGYTAQYAGLEKLYEENKGKVVVLGFPANNFANQEPGNDAEIASFCRLDYGVTFPIFKKSSVLKPEQNAVYTWLSDPKVNGWNTWVPSWNFCKYVVDEKGNLTDFFGSAITPDSIEMRNALKQ
jgi:glutathione peroxidase